MHELTLCPILKQKKTPMRNYLIIAFLTLTILGCKDKKISFKTSFELKESYNLLEVYPDFLKTDSIISDSLDGKYLLWNVFRPNIGITKTNESYVDTTSILGFVNIKDTSTVLEYFNNMSNKNIFPSDINFSFMEGGLLGDDLRSLIGLKKNKSSIKIEKSNIRKITAIEGGVMGILSPNSFKKLRKNESYNIEIELENQFAKNLENETYTLCLVINDKLYSGSVVKSKLNRPIYIGQLDFNELSSLKNDFGEKFIIE